MNICIILKYIYYCTIYFEVYYCTIYFEVFYCTIYLGLQFRVPGMLYAVLCWLYRGQHICVPLLIYAQSQGNITTSMQPWVVSDSNISMILSFFSVRAIINDNNVLITFIMEKIFTNSSDFIIYYARYSKK